MDPPPASGDPSVPEPAVPPRAEPSFERVNAPPPAVAAPAAQEPPLPENLDALSAAEDPRDTPSTADEPPPESPPQVSVPAAVPAPLTPAPAPENAAPAEALPPVPEKSASAGESPRPASSTPPPEDYFPPAENVATITTGPPRIVSGSVGNNFTVTLPGIGWTYLPDEAASGKIRYMGKVVDRGDTVFAFSPFEKGEYNLRFQQQDLAANTLRYDDVALTVDPPGGPAPPGEAASAPAPPRAPPASSANPPAAQPPPAAAAPGAASPPASPEAETAPAGETELERLQRLSGEEAPGSLAELEKYIAGHEAELAGLDELYFFLAQMFEKDTPARDIKKSLLYYEKVRDRFPLSSRWQTSDLRSRYIRLNYFDIR